MISVNDGEFEDAVTNCEIIQSPVCFVEVDATCSDFDFGTALHIAASNLCTSAVKCLLELGANPAFRVSDTVFYHTLTHQQEMSFSWSLTN